MCLLVLVHCPCQGCTKLLLLLLLRVGGNFVLLTQLSPSHSFHMAGHTALGTQHSHPIPPPSLQVGRSLLFQVVIHLMTQSAPYQCWALHLVILVWILGIMLMNLLASGQQSVLLFKHLPWFHGKGVNTKPFPTWTMVWLITPFGPRSWRRLWAWSWSYPHWPCQITKTRYIHWKLATSFDAADTMPLQYPQGFYAQLMAFLIFLSHRLFLASNLKLLCQARALLFPVPQAGKMWASKFIHYFFQSSSSIWIPGFFTT